MDTLNYRIGKLNAHLGAQGDYKKMMNKYSKGPMPFRYAWFQMLNGKKVKLPSWAGYWALEDGTIKMHCRDGSVIDIRETDNPVYTFTNIASDDWIVVDD